MKEWSVYSIATGEIVALLTDPVFPALDIVLGQDAIEGYYDQATYYIDSNQDPVLRQVMPLIILDVEMVVGEVFRVDGVPIGSIVSCSTGEMVVVDGFFEWQSMMPGPETFALDHSHYLRETINVNVTSP